MRLPEYVHEASVAGLEPKATPRPVRQVSDNTPTAAFIAQRIRELEGDLGAQEDLLEALPLHVQDEVWAIFRTGG